MSETVRFQLARAPQRRRPSRAESLPLFDPPVAAGSLFVREGVDPVEDPNYPGYAVIAMAALWRDDPSYFVDPYRPATPVVSSEDPTPRDFAIVIDVLRELDDWLAASQSSPAVNDLMAEAARLAVERADVELEALVTNPRWVAAWDSLARSLCALLAADAAGNNNEAASRAAGRLQRLLLVAGLVEALVDDAIRPERPEDVRRLLRDRVVVVPSPPFPIVDVEPVAPRRRGRIAQRAGFGDLWVLREEWSCYQPGEIAHIENVLEGERRERVHTRIDETEITETVETETTRTDELDSQTTDRFELTEEASRDTSLAIRVDAQVDTSGQYGPTKVETHIGGSLDWSVDESRRRASEVAHESVERAIHRVEERIRTERVRRTLTRIEERNLHEINNSENPTGNVVGVYRWVDKIQRMQLFRYPNRYLLEFQIPQPAALVRWIRERDSGPQPTTPPPPPFTTDGQPLRADESNLFTISSFGPDNYGRFAARWRATVDAPPDDIIWVSGSAAIAVEEEAASSVPTLAAPPSTATTIRLVVPDGYAAVGARASAAGAPIHADWLDHPAPWEGDPVADGWDDRDGYHIIRAEVTVGSETIPLYDPARPTVTPATNVALTPYANAWLSYESGEVTLEGRPQREFSAGVTFAGAYKGAVSVALRCAPTRATIEQWRLNTYTALLAYRSWQADYESERNAIQAREGVVIEGSSPARNREVIREELKRLVIEMLYGYNLTGVAAIDRGGANGRPAVNIDAALDAAPEIQFLEQIFEWDKLTYVLYPYYWAWNSEWPALQPIEGADAEYARFLRAGSARVVVAARPGYASAVNHWLWFGRPWGGDMAPTPGQEGYVSIADEIRTLNQAPDDGEPQESWEVRLPTTLIWLDPDPSLPKYNAARRLDEPADPRTRLCSPTDSALDGGTAGNQLAPPRSPPPSEQGDSDPVERRRRRGRTSRSSAMPTTS